MATEPKPAKLTDEQRHARFVEMAQEVDASEETGAFDRAFEKVVHPPPAKSGGDDG